MDKDQIPQLVHLGSTKQGVQQAQALSKGVMERNGYGLTLHNACAATLSEFMNLANVNVPITLGAGNLARRIENRGWKRISIGDQHAGDVAVAKNNVHIFFVVQAIDDDIMLIADNQASGPHRRKASGDPELNHSPVAYFLRADGAIAPEFPVEEVELFPGIAEVDTASLREPFNDNGEQVEVTFV